MENLLNAEMFGKTDKTKNKQSTLNKDCFYFTSYLYDKNIRRINKRYSGLNAITHFYSYI